jgi:WD40 repeat protein
MAGENYDIYVFDGFPTKTEKTIHGNQNFVNKLAFNQSGSFFVSASADKNLTLYDGKTLEQV